MISTADIDSANAKAQLDLGDILFAGRNADVARKHAEVALHDNPQNAEAELMRVIELPAEVEAEKVTATLKNGVLELSLPKAAKARSVRIEPKAAA